MKTRIIVSTFILVAFAAVAVIATSCSSMSADRDFKLACNATDGERHRFHPAGWTAVPNRTKCTGCQKCANAAHGCPVEALSFGEDSKVIIDQEKCVGCGICKSRCEYGAIQIKQTMPMRKDLQEYFRKDYNLDLKL